MYAIKTFDEEHSVLATGDEPELHRMLLERRQHGEWQFPVVIEKETAKPWDDAAYLASMKIDSKQGEREDVKAIRQAHKHGKHTLRELADSTAMELNRVKDLVH
ncbi:hypothetical protein KC401_13810, partial [Lactiplantibacillus plantarum]|nr:hypothetical protein [Lactiplantibacillus plantarum]MCZ9410744.1 hypothetical protein [Lactiplantibacillus plantarum]